MAPHVRVDEFEDGQRESKPIPSVDQQPQRLTRAQIMLGLTEVAHGAALIDRLFGVGALAEDRAGVDWELGDYGLRVVRTMIDSGEIFARFRTLTGGSLPDADRFKVADHHIRSGLAVDAVAEGLHSFFRRVQTGKWNPSRGAALATYFSNGCVLEFKRPYEKWLKTLQEIPFGDIRDETLPSHDRDLQEEVADSVDLERWQSRLTEIDRRIVDLIIDGKPPSAIAEETGYSRERIRRKRRRLGSRLNDYLRERERND